MPSHFNSGVHRENNSLTKCERDLALFIVFNESPSLIPTLSGTTTREGVPEIQLKVCFLPFLNPHHDY